MYSELALMEPMTQEQRMMFQIQYRDVAKSRTTALLLTFFLGGVGAHRFYLGQVGMGIIYLVFVWTFVPAIIAFVELFLIRGRVDRYNEAQATELAARIRLLRAAA